MNNEWKSIKLGDICSIKGGKRLPKGSSLTTDKTKHPYIRIRDMYQHKYIENNGELEFVDEDTFKTISNYIVNSGDVIIAIVGNTIGLVSLIGKSLDNASLTENCVKLINLDGCLSEYIYYYLNSEKGQNQIKSKIVGTSQPKLPIYGVKDIEIALPKLDEQKKIIDILSSLDKKIEINNKINKKLEEMAQAIFKQWFVDFEFPNEDGKPYKSSGGEMVESELGMIPKYWKNKELKEVIKFTKGKKPKIITDKEFDNSELYLTIDVLNRNSIQYAINDKVILANKKDILMVMDGASSGSLYYGLDGIVGSTLSKLVINDEYINDDILYYFLKLNEFNIKGHLTGSAIPHTDKEYVNRLIMCIPNDKELLVRVTKILSDIREKVIINNEENSRLIKLRDILLPKFMSGEIRVPLGHE